MISQKNKPAWAGDDLPSRVVNALIQTKPLYAVMKHQARQVLIKTAEKNGVPWRKTYQELEASGIQQNIDQIANPSVIYPEYYQQPFHAYDQGNLCWSAAFEAESATYAMALRVWPKESLTWQEAQARLRGSFHQVLSDQGVHEVANILDIGCSVGISTLALHRYFQAKQDCPIRTIGLDLSPYMLAVAQQRDTSREIAQWLHAQGENTGLPDSSVDLVTLQFILHELPRYATQALFQETWRLLKPGGYLAIVDNNPRSPVIQNLPPVLFTLMKSTEPWTDDYYTFDVEAALIDAGYELIISQASDPRHRTIIGRKPTEL